MSDDKDEDKSENGSNYDPSMDTQREEWCKPVDTNFDLDFRNPQNKGRPIIIEDEEDRQPTNTAAELLRYHHKFGHVSFTKLQEMAKMGTIPKRLAKCPIPACSACMYAKAIKRKWRSRTANNREEAAKPTKPGERVSVDQLVSPTPGLVAQMTGFLTTKRYKYATVYVDQASRLSFVWLQKTATAEETLLGKEAFEQYAKERGVGVQGYHADNGIFKAYAWVMACRNKGQALTFAGVNAHHQNGIAERKIRSLQELARTMLLHANNRWPKAVTANLWPYAIRMANDVLNETPNLKDKSKRTAQQIFSNTNVQVNPKHWKPFGCPVYVLDSKIQGGSGIFHKWKSRAKVGVYLGRSPQHARSVALVLDRQTALVSPQFHINFDPSFHTVKQDEYDSKWQLKAGFIGQREPKKNPPKQGLSEPARKRPKVSWNLLQTKATDRNPPPEGAADLASPQSTEANDRIQDKDTESLQQPDASHQNGSSTGQTPDKTPRKEQEPVERLIEAMMAEIKEQTSNDIEGEIFCLEAMFPYREDDIHPLTAFKATSDPDTMYLHEAMKEPDKKEFIEAMRKEVRDQSENGNFTVMPRSQLPKGATVLPTVWQMKRKRNIRTRKVKKYKARLNIDGSRMQKGKHYDETYAPVVSWNSLRLLLTLTAVHGWHTRQLDYVLAFPQAPVEREIYMSIPRGFSIDEGKTDDFVLNVHKNIYGQKQAGRVWNQYLTKKLIDELGFTQSKIDECVFYRGKTMYTLYTDDSILAGPDEKEIDKIILDLQAAKLDITDEGDLEDFLGVQIERMEDGTIHLTQPHLIDQILKDLRLDNENVTTKDIPASSSRLLSRHSNSEAFDNSFHYKSVIGKLNYLEKSTRSDIAYITHQCARFTSAPKKEHGQALRWLGRYLRETKKYGTILRPVKGKDLELYVDADFSGNWDANETWDRDTARSRHGYIIKYEGCAIMWKSQMQTEIALSSTESEYTGLSYGLRDVIPIMRLLKEMKELKYPIHTVEEKVHCRVFEDNSGALEIAKTHKFRPRTKHLNVKLHHFRDYVTRGEISIHPIDTTMQQADYLTKPVNFDILSRLRSMVMRW